MKHVLLLFLSCLSLLSQGQQPIKALVTPFTSYAVNPDSCIRIDHPSGSIIFIEAGGIISSKPQVTIHYREFSSPLDMLINGVQMHMQLGDQSIQLESSGMFEIYALDGQDTLSFDATKTMEVWLNSPIRAKRGTEGYRYANASEGWRGYTSIIGRSAIEEDTERWGSSAIDNGGFDEFDGGFDAFGTSNDEVTERVFQSMNLTDFGMFNYDRMIEGVEYRYLQPQFVTESKQSITSTIYVVYDNINSIFYFPPYTWKEQFFLIPDQSYQLFTIMSDGLVARVKDFPNLPEQTMDEASFILVPSSDVPTTKQELANQTGLQ